MNPKIVAIIQARLSSTRLPGKVLLPLMGKPALEHVIKRLGQSKFINQLIVATTLEKEDDDLVTWLKASGLSFFRGDLNHVLSRFYNCAIEHQADIIVRVTSDNPLCDPSLVDEVIQGFLENNADYAANNLKKTFPHGLDVEVVSFHALREAFEEAQEKFEIEHVTQFIRHRPDRYKLINIQSPHNHHDIRLTLDEREDWQLIEIVMKLVGEDADYNTITSLFNTYPALKHINMNAKERHATYNKKEQII